MLNATGSERGKKKNPAAAVCNFSFEHVLQHVEPSGLLLTSNQGLSATTPVEVPGSTNLRFKDLVADREQRRVNLV